ncbi:hypothetical protein COV93_01965 [Candidatus Woesearchaeota archaeon CG11_big_fil_rev_8_21_14_0_20_43_8]|nr:MAG: hypothetical protein COV93_01965 [Candidatus Woesearchaeota archaeon CG11_big_fil_rev_8_21_14_0_20_43_8]PIO04679.1 MAG: hypothetical protein COT47_08025 [Candidatus Woesearchaeota archaeon CG08_land_8_20_14_0_20_43_7]
MKDKRDVIVIGAGPGGLVAGTKLQQNGLDVTIIEMCDKVGGLAQSWKNRQKLKNGERTRATMEIIHAILGMDKGGHTYKLLEDMGCDMENIGRFEAAKKFGCLRTPHDSPLEVLNDIDSNRRYLLETFPEKTDDIDRLFDVLRRLNNQLVTDRQDKEWKKNLENFIEPRIDNPYLKLPFYLLTKPTLIRHHRKTFQEIIYTCTKDKDLHAWGSVLFGYDGLPNSRISGTMRSAMLLAYFNGGGPQAPAEHSYQAMFDEIARTFVEVHGGELRTLSRMEEIIVEDGAVKGIKYHDRKTKETKILYADRVIIAGDMKKALLPLKEHLPKKYFRRLEEQEMSISLMSVHAIVDMDLSRYKDELSYAANVLASSRDASEIADGDNFPEHFVMYVSVPTILRPDAGLMRDDADNPTDRYHIVDIVMQSPSISTWNSARSISKKFYNGQKDQYAEMMLQITEDMLIPGLCGSVQYKEVYTAKTIERFCGCTDGAVYNFAATPKQFIPNRFSPQTPIKGLYLTGSTVMSAGVGGAFGGGEMTVRDIEKDK